MEIGVCSWSIDRRDPIRAIVQAGETYGFHVIQLGFFGAAALEEADVAAMGKATRSAGVTPVGIFVAFDDEDYGSIERIAQTGGFVPDEEFSRRLALLKRGGILAAELGCETLAIHAATLPQDPTSPQSAKLVQRVREAADALVVLGVSLLLETGRESAETLRTLLEAVDRPNVGVNFDPANFIVFGTDDPARALSVLRGSIACVHMKDAIASDRPGATYGTPAPLGHGDAAAGRIVSKLRASNFAGPLLVETGSALATPDNIRGAAEYLRSMLG